MAETKKVNILVQMNGDAEQKIKNLGIASDQGGRGFTNLTGSIFKAELALRALDFTLNATKKVLGGIYDIAESGANLDRLIKVNEVLYRNLNDKTLPSLEQMRLELESANTYGSNAENAIKTLLAGGLVPLANQVDRLNQKTGEVDTGFDAFILTIKDLAAAAGVSSSQGIELITRSLNQMNPSYLETMGIQINLAQLWKKNADTLQGLSGEQLVATQRQLFFNEIMKEGEKVVGAYDETYKTAGKNLLSIEDAFRSTKEVIGLALQPAFQFLTAEVLNLIKAFREIIKNNEPQIRAFAENLAVKFQNLKDKIIEVFQKVKPYIEDFVNFLVENKDSVATFVKVLLGLLAIGALVGIIALIAGAFNPLMLIIPAIALAVTLMKKAWDENLGGIQEKVRAFVDFAKEKFEQFKNTIDNIVNSAPVQMFIKVMKEIGQQILGLLKERVDKARESFERIAPKLKELWDKLEPVRKVLGELVKVWLIIQGVILAVTAVIVGVLLVALFKLRNILFDIVIKAFEFVIDAIIGFIDFINSVPGAVSDFVDSVKEFFEGLVETAEETWNSITEGISQFVDDVIAFFTNLIVGVHDQLNQIVQIDGEELADFIQRKFNEAKERIQQWITDVGAKIQEWKNTIVNIFNSLRDGIKNAFQSAQDWIQARIDQVKGFLQGLRDWGVSIFNSMKDHAISIFNKIVAPIQNAFQKVGNFVNGVIDSIKNTLTNLWSSVTNAGGSIASAFRQSINALIDKLNGVMKFSFDVLGKTISIDLPDIPKLARGGEVETYGKQLIMVGDNASGRERIKVTPLEKTDGGGFGGNSGGQQVNYFIINGYNKDKRELAEEIRDLQAKENKLAEYNSEF